MKNAMKKAVAVFSAALVLSACTKLDEGRVNGNAQLQVRLTDAPGNYDAVFIEIEDILIHRSDNDSIGEEGWESIEGVKRGIYNLLDLVNGRDTLLVDANVPTGHLGHLRLMLGNENRVEIDGKEYELKTPSALQSGLKLKINGELEEDPVYEILLDFDAARSVVKTADSGQYILKPVIRVLKGSPAGGTVRGIVSPGNVNTAVLAVKGNDTLGTYTDTLGNYMLKAIPPGNYSMHYLPDSASNLTVVDTTGIIINDGEVSQINITLPPAADPGLE